MSRVAGRLTFLTATTRRRALMMNMVLVMSLWRPQLLRLLRHQQLLRRSLLTADSSSKPSRSLSGNSKLKSKACLSTNLASRWSCKSSYASRSRSLATTSSSTCSSSTNSSSLTCHHSSRNGSLSFRTTFQSSMIRSASVQR